MKMEIYFPMLGVALAVWLLGCDESKLDRDYSSGNSSNAGTLSRVAESQKPLASKIVQKNLSKTEIARLEAIWLKPPDPANPRNSRYAAGEALRELMASGQRDAVRSVMKVFDLPAESFFSDDADDRNFAHDSHKFTPVAVMSLISWYVEGTPPPISQYYWTMKDIPVWRDWWVQNSETFRLKETPSRPKWIEERGIVAPRK